MASEIYDRGDMVWAEDPYKMETRTRPWLIISNTDHPYLGTEYLATPLTTKQDPRRVRVAPEDFIEGGLKEVSYVTAWTYTSLREDNMEEVAGIVKDYIVDEVRETFMRFTQ